MPHGILSKENLNSHIPPYNYLNSHIPPYNFFFFFLLALSFINNFEAYSYLSDSLVLFWKTLYWKNFSIVHPKQGYLLPLSPATLSHWLTLSDYYWITRRNFSLWYLWSRTSTVMKFHDFLLPFRGKYIYSSVLKVSAVVHGSKCIYTFIIM